MPVKKAFGEEQLTGSERHVDTNCLSNVTSIKGRSYAHFKSTLDQTLHWHCYYKLPPTTVDCKVGE